MQTPEPSTSWVNAAFTAIAVIVASLLTALFGKRKSTSAKENAEARNLDGETINRAWTRIDQQQATINAQAAELLTLRPLAAEVKELRDWTRRMQREMTKKGVRVPERYQSGG